MNEWWGYWDVTAEGQPIPRIDDGVRSRWRMLPDGDVIVFVAPEWADYEDDLAEPGSPWEMISPRVPDFAV